MQQSFSRQPIRVLHITFDMRIGGTEQVIKNLVESADSQLFDMSVLCLESPIGPFGQLLAQKGVTISCLQRNAGFDLQLIRQIRKHIQQHHIEIVHCHQYTPWVYGCLAAIFTGAKVIFTEHGRFYPDSTTWKRKYINPILQRLTHASTAISKATKEALTEFEFIPADKIQVIYNGIIGLYPQPVEQLRQELHISPDEIVVGTVARLDPIKNHSMMLHAFKQVIDSGIKARLLIVGDGEERSNIESLISQLQLEAHVIMTGYITEPQRYIQLMDIYLLSSLSEGTSMTLLEAMSLAKPCVVTDAGGNPEIIEHNYNGLVTANDDAPAFAQAIITLCREPDLRAQMGQHAKQRFEHAFTTGSMTKTFEQLYQQLTGH